MVKCKNNLLRLMAVTSHYIDQHSQLWLVGVGATVGHAEHTTTGVRQVGFELVFESFAPGRLSACTEKNA